MSNASALVRGVDLHELCQEYGTPLYVYDADVVRSQLESLRAAFGALEPKVLFAAKALSTFGVLQLVRSMGTGLDAVSIEEVRLGLRAGFLPADVLFTPSCVAFEEIEEAVQRGVGVTIESLSALERFARAFGDSVPCALRLHPRVRHEGPTGEALEAWHHDSKFGIDDSLLSHALGIIARRGVRVHGLHVHTISHAQSVEGWLAVAEAVFDKAERFRDLERLDFGGGFAPAGFGSDAPLDVADLGRRFAAAFTDFREAYGRRLALWLEPGRWLVAGAGTLLTRVQVVKSNGSAELAGVDSGFHHFVRPRLYGAAHAISNLSNPGGPPRRYDVVGQLCEPDAFASGCTLPEVREGDLLAIHDAGAYGSSMASNYNSRPRPAEVLVRDGAALPIRRRESLEDLLATQIALEL